MMSDRRRVRVRQLLTFLVNVYLIVGISILSLHPTIIGSNLDSTAQGLLIATIASVVATFGGLFAVIYFLTAQLKPGGAKRLALVELYRAPELFLLLGTICLSLASLFCALILPDRIFGNERSLLLGISFLFATYLILITVPLGLIQIENLNPATIARKLINMVDFRGIRNYDLARVQRDNLGRLRYSLQTHGLNYDRSDPLRPTHELFQGAIDDNDRLLLGKLVGLLCERIAAEFGRRWPTEGTSPSDWSKGWSFSLRSMRRSRNVEARVAFALHLIHYLRRLARNTLTSWVGLDVGRHATQYQLSKLCSVLASAKSSDPVLRMCLFAIMHVSLDYTSVKPYGRVEPLNGLIVATGHLERSGRQKEAELAAAIIGLVDARTDQLGSGRAQQYISDLSGRLYDAYKKGKESFFSDSSWLPGNDQDDPWR